MKDIIKLDKLGMSLTEQTLFDDLSFTLQSDAWLTVVGPSGGGKSTLLKIVAGLQTATTGTVTLVEGAANISAYRQAVSYAVQSAHLFGKTVRENLNLPFEVRQLVPDEQKQIAGLTLMALAPEFLDKPIEELSGGERQRVGLLRNLIFPPQVLLLDEITTGLDAQTKETIWQTIEHLQTEHHFAVMSVTHDEAEIAQAKWVLTVGDGKVVFNHE
ncbi:MAG: ATP-binding cassette domain-containing protein [Lactobacillaceae bacterium]|jgi:putative ABC transport system ATP-binding protein|nr:ATP-binding cassette domain-containing protein [Lactobacillaceae bacterium]